MKNKMKSVVSIVLMLCLAMTVLLGSVTEVKAASYKKKITKTVTLKGGKVCKFHMDTKDPDSSIKVTVAASGSVKGRVQVTSQELNAGGTLTNKKKSVKFSSKDEVATGEHEVYIANYGTGKVKLKITVTSKKANLKYKNCKTYSVEG